MSHTWRYYPGDDGFSTLTLGHCTECGLEAKHCDCDDDAPSGDRSKHHIRGYN